MMDEETIQEIREILRDIIEEADEWNARSSHSMASTEAAARRIREQIDSGEVEE